MKTALVLLIICLGLFPNGKIYAYTNNSYKVFVKTSAFALTTNKKDLKVKNRRQAMAMAQASYKAKVLSVASDSINGNPGYKVKLLSKNGTVFYVLINAKTGQMRRQ